MRFGFIQGVAIWEKDMVEVNLISPPSSQPLQLQLFSYSCNIHSTWLDKGRLKKKKKKKKKKDKEALSD